MNQRVVGLLGVFTVAIVAGWIGTGNAQEDGERRRLSGVWRGYVVDGKGENPDRGPLHLEVTITPDKITARNLDQGGKGMGEGTYRLDPSRKLKEIEATGVVLPGVRARTFPGIYEVEGNTLRWCVDNTGKSPPTEFVSRKGQYLLILKRQGK
jgi:uncharacterized protein (TIGR03067 family)